MSYLGPKHVIWCNLDMISTYLEIIELAEGVLFVLFISQGFNHHCNCHFPLLCWRGKWIEVDDFQLPEVHHKFPPRWGS